MYDQDSPEAALGDWAQGKTDIYLREIGMAIVDAHKSGGGRAALVRGKYGAIPVMDTIAIGGGEVRFVDSKGKTQSTFTRITQEEQHGIDARNWDGYIQQCEDAGVNGFIVVCEKTREVAPLSIDTSNVLLVYPLSNKIKGLRRVGRSEMASAYGKGGMVYWDRDAYLFTESLNE